MINGIVVKDEVDKFFIGSSGVRPLSLKGRITTMKAFDMGFWYQGQQYFSNLNIMRLKPSKYC